MKTLTYEAKSDQTRDQLKRPLNYEMLDNTATREQFWQYFLLLLS